MPPFLAETRRVPNDFSLQTIRQLERYSAKQFTNNNNSKCIPEMARLLFETPRPNIQGQQSLCNDIELQDVADQLDKFLHIRR
jgi:hypothetical protein